MPAMIDRLVEGIPGEKDGGYREAETTLLESVARPVDIHLAGGKIYICEYERELKNVGMTMGLTGRILEFAVVEMNLGSHEDAKARS